MPVVFIVAVLAFFAADVAYKVHGQSQPPKAATDGYNQPLDDGPTSRCPKEFFCPNVPSGPDNGYPQ